MNRSDFDRIPLRPATDIVHRQIAGEQILVPVRSGAAQIDFLFTSNEVGSFIFGLLDGRRDARAIARLLSEEFDIAEDRAHADLLDFLDTLCEARLVDRVDEEGS
ncbi:MAG TPA: PqqD family protein [Candidatus Polarisedimenticolia bacterium]